MKVLVILLVLVGIVGFAFASHDPDQPYTHSIVLPDMQEKTFEEFMDWCVPFYGEKCTKFYGGTSTLPPLKQTTLGIPYNEIQCKENLVLVQKYDGSPACVTESTKQKLIERGWTGSITESEYSILRDILDRCEEIQRTGTFDGFAYGSSWQNETHYIDNNSCRWIYLEKYLDENNELNFALKYDNNGMIIDDLQRIYDYCDYSGKKPDWYFSWNNQTHHIDSSQCKWYGCDDGEIYYRGVCMTPEAKEKAQSVGEKENEN